MASSNPNNRKLRDLHDYIDFLRSQKPMNPAQAKHIQDELQKSYHKMNNLQQMALYSSNIANQMAQQAYLQSNTPIYSPQIPVYQCDICHWNSTDYSTMEQTQSTVHDPFSGTTNLQKVTHCKDKIQCIAEARRICDEWKERQEKSIASRPLPF